MVQEYIVIKGARENNLKNISLDIPKRKITIFTGVSGSGKSSLVFDTISAEAQRQLNENYTAFVRKFLPQFPQPDVDVIDHLSTAITVDQKRLGGNSRSTMGTITDIYAFLRLLFSRIGQPYGGYAYEFSFNEPSGMCPECDGIGIKMQIDLDKLLDKSKSLNEGAIAYPGWGPNSFYQKSYTYSGLFDNDKPLKDYSEQEWDDLLYGKDKKVNFGDVLESNYEGVVDKFTRLYLKNSDHAESTRNTVARFLKTGVCPLCHGARLNQKALASKIKGYNIAEMSAMQASDLVELLRDIDDPIGGTIAARLIERLQDLIDIGLGYLSLNRETSTLSGGESQRIKMVKHLASSLTDLLYIFDEPSIGLHPRDVHRLNDLLRKLRDKGNTVLVVEHDPDVIPIADHVVDMGPRAGANGGEVVYQGTFEGLKQTDTLTAKYISKVTPIKTEYRKPTGQMSVKNATLHNLKNVTVDIPKGVLTAITGVAGSGKSTLIYDIFLEQHPDAIVVDQSALGVNVRSNPATYTGIMDDIRALFAKQNKVKPGLFSYNSKGACEHCQGLGFIYTDLAFLEPIRTPCEICQGKRFKDEVLAYTVNGKSISDVLDMTMREAHAFFDQKSIKHTLATILDVGLDYLSLGQPLSTLSGGECQRVKLASELHKQGSVYVMDEPTTGLHLSDVAHLLGIMDRLVDGGNSVIVIEHNLEVIKHADWIIDMGPEAGHDGGQVIFEGTPSQLLASKGSLTGEYLRRAI